MNIQLMLLKLPDFLRPTYTLPFLQSFFDPVMIKRSIGLLQIKFPNNSIQMYGGQYVSSIFREMGLQLIYSA